MPAIFFWDFSSEFVKERKKLCVEKEKVPKIVIKKTEKITLYKLSA